MNPHPPNPYQSPKEEEVVAAPSAPLLPPITPARLVIGLVLITIGWLGLWLKIRGNQLLGIWMIALAAMAIAWVVDPSARARRQPSHWKLWHSLIFGLLIAGAFSVGELTKGTKPRLWLEEAMVHPAALFLGWLLSYGCLVLAWWRRRKNPPYDPQPEGQEG